MAVHVINNEKKDTYQSLLKYLATFNQQKLIKFILKTTTTDKTIKNICKKLAEINYYYPGGLAEYIKSAKKLLNREDIIKIDKDKFILKTPDLHEINITSTDYKQIEEIGLNEISKTCFVLAAGGIGERLGFNNIKLSLPVENITYCSYLELYCKSIFFLQKTTSSLIPLVIMTSSKTYEPTNRLLNNNAFYGLDKNQIHILKQSEVLAFCDKNCQIDFDYKLQDFIKKPYGHGEIHSLIYRSNLLNKWSAEGKKWLVFFQDTNSLIFNNILSTLGYSALNKYDLNFMTIPRRTGDVLGSFVSIKSKKELSEKLLAVEYNQLNEFIQSYDKNNEEKNYSSDTGFSFFPGNINQFIISLKSYTTNIKKCAGKMPEFINYKKSSSKSQKFATPARIETMMQDYIQQQSNADTVALTFFPNKTIFSPAKYSFSQGENRNNLNQKPYNLMSSEKDYFKANLELLEHLGVNISEIKGSYKEQLIAQPKVILPIGSFFSLSNLSSIFPTPTKIYFNSQSILVCQDCDIIIHSLKLTGALFIKGCKGSCLHIEDTEINNKGFSYHLFGKNTNVTTSTNRGYYVKEYQKESIILEKPGTWCYKANKLSLIKDTI